jgi:alanyl-tRNA synthetase
MRTDEIRQRYLDFFAERGHRLCPSDSLVPANDPTLLFTGAGMNQFKDNFLGLGPEDFTRATTAQKCIRTGDIMNVGVTASHHTFFEMMGNFSFGDYFKREAITWAWEFLTGVLAIPEARLQATIYLDDDEAYGIWKEEVGLPDEKITRLGEHDNFWPADAPSQGPNGPCGPCSEIFYDRGEAYGAAYTLGSPEDTGRRYVEIWNLVFTQFDRQPDGSLPPLPQKNIDTGMGLERMAACLQDVPTNMDIDIFQPLVAAVAEKSGVAYRSDPERDVLMRRIADHARAVAFCIADGVLPANSHRGYVLKRLLRRAVLDGRTLGIEEAFLHELVPVVGRVMGAQYPEVGDRVEAIAAAVAAEEEKFLATLQRGLSLIDNAVARAKAQQRAVLDGATAFELYDTYGFPYELAEEVVAREGLGLDREGFEEALEAARQTAREGAKMKGDIFAAGPLAEVKKRTGPTPFRGYERLDCEARVVALLQGDRLVEEAAAGEEVQVVLDQTAFYGEAGGQVGDTGVIVGPENLVVRVVDTQKADGIAVHVGEVESGVLRAGQAVNCQVDAERRDGITRNHTATHLLHWALRTVLGEAAEQKGSWVGPDRLRFDFQHGQALSLEELRQVEELANQRVLENAPVQKEVLSLQAARERGAIALFGEKYGAEVRMVACGDFSKELCGGCHVDRTGEIGLVHLLAEESVSAGVRRLEGCTGLPALRTVRNEANVLTETAQALNVQPAEVPARVAGLSEELKTLRRELNRLKQQEVVGRLDRILAEAEEVDGIRCAAVDLGEADGKTLRNAGDDVRQKLGSGVALLGGAGPEKAALVCVVTDDVQAAHGLKAGDIVREAAAIVGGKGGGRPDMAQAGGKEPQKLPEALAALPGIVAKLKQS